ncbi:MAG: YitT family protein [Lachnospiraceae bacterium]|nr:YitT family protein [Lachnospiraceae bacterium]
MKKRFEDLFSGLIIILGALLASFSVICILIPNDAIDYGTAGIAIIVSKLTGFNLSLCVLFIFLPFWILGAKRLGKRFGFKSLLGSAVYTIGLELFERVPFELSTEHFLAVAFGGAILGFGLALILRVGGCIDGSEILANLIVDYLSKKTGKNYSLTYILLTFNACVYIVAFLVINQNAALLSLLVYVVATSVITNVTDHFDAIKQVTIITKNPDHIILEIKEELNKTCTLMDSFGMIAGENKTLICYVSYFELQKMKEIISRNKGSFCTVTTIDEILR